MINTIKAWAKSIDDNDLRFLLSMLIGVVLWWIFIGRKRYSIKGMK